MLKLELFAEYDDTDTAEAVHRSLEPDNDGHLETELIGRRVKFTIEADNAGTLRNTADDLLACIKIAEEALGLVAGTVTDLDSDPFLE